MISKRSRGQLCIVGGMPKPVGGVTNFLYRFTVHFHEQVERILDLYPHENKCIVAGVEHLVRPTSKLLSVVWLIYQFLRYESGIVYFNFSLPHSLLLLLFIPKRRGVKWALTLHHGELSLSMSKASRVIQRLSKMALQRVDRVGFIGVKQHRFYKDAGVHDEQLYGISTYLPFVKGVSSDGDDDKGFVHHKLDEFKQTYPKLVVASGYPTSLYRHDWVLSFFEKQLSDVGLVLCLYGHDSEGLLATYREWALRLPNVIVFEGLSPQGFQEVLKSSDIYVRPTLTDSYGVAVAEALECGMVVIASDACERANGAHLFNRNDREVFEALLNEAINEKLKQSEGFADNGVNSLEKLLDLKLK